MPVQIGKHADHFLQSRTLLAEILRAFGIVPDGRVFEFAADLGQLLALVVIVKDTPSRIQRVPADP
jgi:hypothetical protein